MAGDDNKIFVQATLSQSIGLIEALMAKVPVTAITLTTNGKTYTFNRSFFGNRKQEYDLAMKKLASELGEAISLQINDLINKSAREEKE